MPKRRFRWWADVRRLLQDYPEMCRNGPRSEREAARLKAVRRALDRLDCTSEGPEIREVLELTLWGTKTAERTAPIVGYCPATVYRRQSKAIFAVAEELGYLHTTQKRRDEGKE